jgi:hypothetical protein
MKRLHRPAGAQPERPARPRRTAAGGVQALAAAQIPASSVAVVVQPVDAARRC